MTTAKMVGALRVTSGTSIWVTEINGSPVGPFEIALTPGLYYVIDGTPFASDLLTHISTQWSAATGDDIEFSISSSGIVSHNISGVTSMKVQWSAPSGETASAEYVQEWLRFDDQGDTYTLTTTPIAGYRTHAYGYYPTYYLQTDLERYEPRASQLVPDNGDTQNIKIARRKKYKLKVRSFGFPRESGYNEYHALEDWHDHAISGRPFRLYADTDTTTAAYSTSNRYGYQTMTLEPDAFEPAPLAGNWYKHMAWEFVAHEYTG